MQRGARSFQLKPLKTGALNGLFKDIVQYNERKKKKLLIIEDNEMDSSQIAKILDNGDMIDIEIVDSAAKRLWN